MCQDIKFRAGMSVYRLINLLLVLLVSIVSILLPVSAESHPSIEFRRNHIGRPIWATTYGGTKDDSGPDGAIIVITSLAIVARIDSQEGHVTWRLTPPPATKLVRPIAAESLNDGSRLLVLYSTNQLMCIDNNRGQIVWSAIACGFQVDNDRRSVMISRCGSEASYVHVNIEDGESLSPGEYDGNQTLKDVASLALNPDRLEWQFNLVKISSDPDGKVSATDLKTQKTLWAREEGLGHFQSAGLYTTNERTHIIVLSQLGSIFSLLGEGNGIIQWKKTIQGAQFGNCMLIPDYMASSIVICNNRANRRTTIYNLDVSSGDEIYRMDLEDFICERAGIDNNSSEDNLNSNVVIRILSDEGDEKCISGRQNSTFDCQPGRLWLRYSRGDLYLRAWAEGKELWKVNVPAGSVLLSVGEPQVFHSDVSPFRPSPVRVTGDRQILFHDVRPDIIMALAWDEEESLLHAMLIDGRSGAVYDVVTHLEAAEPISVIRGDSWFVYSFWSTIMLQQEIHVLDLYNGKYSETWLKSALTDVATRVFGVTITQNISSIFGVGSSGSTCDASHDEEVCAVPSHEENIGRKVSDKLFESYTTNHGSPLIVRSNALLSERIDALDITRTKRGIAEPSVVMTTSSGRVVLMSKILLDARRPKGEAFENTGEILLPYRPVLSLKSTSREVTKIGKGLPLNGAMETIATPHNRESMCEIAVFGTDMAYGFVRPVKSFDTLPNDFSYAQVFFLTIVLLILYFISNKLRANTIISRSWR